jgi:glycosyltransferase involved in cell wall biosynthesis
LVSIIVPSFNQGKYIKETIDSILAQDYRPIEVLVLDGGSTDHTVTILKSYAGISELRWWSEPDRGVVDAVNKGLKMTRGDIIAIQSSDDVYLPGAISAAVEVLSKNGEVMLAYGDVELIDERSNCIGKDVQGPFDLKSYLGRFSYIPQPSAFFRAEMIRAVGGWREEVSYAADADFWLRIAASQVVSKLGRVLGRYRYHSEQRDVQSARIARDWERMVIDLLSAQTFDISTQRYARMGIYLAKHHYTPESSWLRRTYYLYRAALANPRAVPNSHFPKRELLIGRTPVWRTLSKIKRALGFKPRS